MGSHSVAPCRSRGKGRERVSSARGGGGNRGPIQRCLVRAAGGPWASDKERHGRAGQQAAIGCMHDALKVEQVGPGRHRAAGPQWLLAAGPLLWA
jgi:hypothetical protein